MIFAQKSLSRMDSKTGIAPVALMASAVLPVLFVLTDLFLPGGIYRLVAFASVGIYIAFQMVVLAALRARMGGWKPSGKWTMGGAGMLVTIMALAYGLFAIYLMVKPGADPEASFVVNYIVLVEVVVVIGVGLVYMLVSGAHRKSDAPAGDAMKK
jgi:amino acid transporter